MPRRDGERRLNPSVIDSDWHLLTQLRSSVDSFISLLDQPSCCFDFGCGDMPYRPVFKESGHAYLGGDLQGSMLADIHFDSDSIVPVPDDSFDVVLSFQVLEHVKDVHGYLSEAKRIMKPGGRLFLSTHGFWTYHPYPTDYWRWTRQGLIKVLEDNGFAVTGSMWVMGMLAYSTMLKLQVVKGACEKVGWLGSAIFPFFSLPSQMLMKFEDYITPESIARDNAAIYCMVASHE